jgi:hypothetical protein
VSSHSSSEPSASFGANTEDRGSPWRLRTVLIVIALAGVFISLWQWSGRNAVRSLTGELSVFVRPNASAKGPLPLDQPGALPVGDDGSMTLEVKLSQPALIYLVWLNCQGQAVPLYPWNTESLQITDVSQPPPARRAAKVLFSPLQLGGGWPLGEGRGMETVLLLARREPLGDAALLGKLLSDLPPVAPVQHPAKAQILALDRGAKAVTVLPPIGEVGNAPAQAVDESLQKLLLSLQPHFELIRAVRFAHAGD